MLQMGGGYVLDFSNRTFGDFFGDFGVDIFAEPYTGSKAHRMRTFWATADADLVARVLAELLERRMLKEPQGLNPAEVERVRAVVARGTGGEPSTRPAVGDLVDSLPRFPFQPDHLGELPLEEALRESMVARMEEARRCIDAKAYLAATILCGSVLEGLCLGVGGRDPARVNRAYTAKYNRAPRKLGDWTLVEWIEVLTHLGDLTPNVEKYAHGLREFRNYVHPREQVASGFAPDATTVDLGFRVVVAAVENLRAATRRPAT